jgi:selenide, water dikinase
MRDPNLIVGMDRPDDAGVYKITRDLALILTLDFFTPIVDDPYDFGQIAVANALSDVYAMGGRPLLAMNIICFPEKTMDIAILQEILRGGSDKMVEAGVLLVGGHSVDDPEIKYGLSVTGTVHPDKVLKNTGGMPGDAVILTKPLGCGIISTAIKAGIASPAAENKIIASMKNLNRKAAEAMEAFDVHACTDVTGFGLLGHACEMIEGTDLGLKIHSSLVHVFPDAQEYARMGLIPGGAYRNREFRTKMVDVQQGISDELVMTLFDPQTSGGLLIVLPGNDAEKLVLQLREGGVEEAAIIGEITDSHPSTIVVEK